MLRDGRTSLRACERPLEYVPHSVARERLVDRFERVRAGERRLEQALELPVRRELPDDPLEDLVSGQRVRQLLRQGPRQRAIENPSDLGRRQEIFHGRLERPAQDPGGDPRGKDGRSADRIGNRGGSFRPLFVS